MLAPRRIPRPCAALLGVALALAPALALGRPPSVAQLDNDPEPEPEQGWRAARALEAPAWLRFGLEHRHRLEHVQNDFRAGADTTALSIRTLAFLELTTPLVVVGLELADSRAYATEVTPLDTGIVNAFDLLQAHVGVRLRDVFVPGDAASLSFGRFTLDVGGRRLIARNDYRNTINSFTGVHFAWRSPGDHQLRVFAVMPVERLPSEPEQLARNLAEPDQERAGTLLAGVFYGSPQLATGLLGANGLRVEGYVLGYRDGADLPAPSRELLNFGSRVHRPPKRGDVDFQAEAILQVGSSRANSTGPDVAGLTHVAFASHVSLGYMFDVGWRPRVAVHHDLATGDRDPDDDRNNRFDTLFGARRFEYGPKGLWNAIARSNLNSPALRFETTPHRTVDAHAAYRGVWLAARRDAWVPAGVRDPTGSSGSFVGHQIEARVRWHVFPGNLSFDVGGVTLIPGSFARAQTGPEVPTMLYAMVTATI
jgi:hypothetical protein